MQTGKFIISLDFELQWGVFDNPNVINYQKNIIGVQTVIPRLLSTFTQYGIKATFSTVGFLFFKNLNELLENLPAKNPNYTNKTVSPYEGYFDTMSKVDSNDILHFAPDLIKEIQKFPDQEIGTHTFSHYYCLEKGQTIDDFESDLKSAIEVGKKNNIDLKSLVFPRNQFNDSYLNVCFQLGIISYRGNENSWFYRAEYGKKDSNFKRFCRLLDTYINISGYNCYSDEQLSINVPINIPSSRFLRPFSLRTRFFEKIRLNRIKSAMTYAAKKNLVYHLWWHPHNFGVNQEQNFDFLNKILEHYQFLNTTYDYKSYTMTEYANNLITKNGK